MALRVFNRLVVVLLVVGLNACASSMTQSQAVSRSRIQAGSKIREISVHAWRPLQDEMLQELRRRGEFRSVVGSDFVSSGLKTYEVLQDSVFVAVRGEREDKSGFLDYLSSVFFLPTLGLFPVVQRYERRFYVVVAGEEWRFQSSEPILKVSETHLVGGWLFLPFLSNEDLFPNDRSELWKKIALKLVDKLELILKSPLQN